MRAPAAFAFVAALVAACARAPEAPTVRVTQTRLRLGPAERPPADADSGWFPTSLPDVWRMARRRVAIEGWYRADVGLERPPTELWAVYLPRIGLNAAVYVNGQLVGDGGSFADPVARNWNRPLFFTVPGGLLAAGANVVHLRMKTDVGSPVIVEPFLLGPAATLRPAYERQYWLQVTLLQIVVGFTLATALLIGLVYVPRDALGAYRWFAAGVLLWAWSGADAFVHEPPLPTALWEWATGVPVGWLAVCFVMAFHRLLERPRPALERALVAAAVGASVVLLAVTLAWRIAFFNAMLLWSCTAIGVAAYLVVLLSAASRDERFRRIRLMVVPGIAAVLFGLHDVASVVSGRLWAGMLLSPYIAPVAMLATSALILAHLMDGLADSERLNRELEQRVREKHGELERNYERLRALERERAVAHERERIMRDMHDGMGGQLVSTLAMVEAGRATPEAIAEALRDALDDMRLVIDSLDPVEEDLTAVLGMVRARLEPRLARHGLQFAWQVADLPPIPGFGPERALQALRIIQEAITNVVKHADARTVLVRTGQEQTPDGTPGVFVEIRDDGRGRTPDATNGRGMYNMTRRAAALGGHIKVDSGPWGTSVRLFLSIRDHVADRTGQRE